MSEQLKWTKQATQVKIKLNRAIGILRKLQNITNRNTLKLIYCSLSGSYIHYGDNYRYKQIQKIKTKKMKYSKTEQYALSS